MESAITMNGYYGYQLHEAERSRTRAEMIDADQRLGRMAAAVPRPDRDRRLGRDRSLGRSWAGAGPGPEPGPGNLAAWLRMRPGWPGRVQEGS